MIRVFPGAVVSCAKQALGFQVLLDPGRGDVVPSNLPVMLAAELEVVARAIDGEHPLVFAQAGGMDIQVEVSADIRNAEDDAFAGDAEQFADRGDKEFVGEVFEDLKASDDVKGFIPERQMRGRGAQIGLESPVEVQSLRFNAGLIEKEIEDSGAASDLHYRLGIECHDLAELAPIGSHAFRGAVVRAEVVQTVDLGLGFIDRRGHG